MEQTEFQYEVHLVTHLFDGTELISTLGNATTKEIAEKRVQNHFNNLESPNFIFQYSDRQCIRKDLIRLITYVIKEVSNGTD